MNLKDKITEYPNFPKKGILFRDFSPILKDTISELILLMEFLIWDFGIDILDF